MFNFRLSFLDTKKRRLKFPRPFPWNWLYLLNRFSDWIKFWFLGIWWANKNIRILINVQGNSETQSSLYYVIFSEIFYMQLKKNVVQFGYWTRAGRWWFYNILEIWWGVQLRWYANFRNKNWNSVYAQYGKIFISTVHILKVLNKRVRRKYPTLNKLCNLQNAVSSHCPSNDKNIL